jgi:hypothetical protein
MHCMVDTKAKLTLLLNCNAGLVLVAHIYPGIYRVCSGGGEYLALSVYVLQKWGSRSRSSFLVILLLLCVCVCVQVMVSM